MIHERNGSVTLCGLTDGAGVDRLLNIHCFRTPSQELIIRLAVLNTDMKLQGAVSIGKDEFMTIIKQVFEQV